MEVHRPRAFENRVLKRLFGPKTDEVTGGRRQLHEKLLLSSKMRCVGHVARMGRRQMHIGY
jgi:hypothetical protein